MLQQQAYQEYMQEQEEQEGVDDPDYYEYDVDQVAAAEQYQQ